MFGTFRSSISLDSDCTSPSIVGNLVMGTKRSADVVEQAEWVRPIAGINLGGASPTEMSDNFVAGSESVGYIVNGDACVGVSV